MATGLCLSALPVSPVAQLRIVPVVHCAPANP
jgi:hypothetical protein